MNPLTLIKRIQNINSKEASLGISEDASWHAAYKESAYVYVGGIPFELTEGDVLSVFAQYGEIVDINLVRDKGTGKPKGFAFIAYEDQRSTILAVDNLNGAQIRGRTIRVDHVSKYKKKEEEDEELEQQKREERGVCRAFQRGECTRGDGCKFSHNVQRAANTGWGADDHRKSRTGDDKFEGSRMERKAEQVGHAPDSASLGGRTSTNKELRESRVQVNDHGRGRHHKQPESSSRDPDYRVVERRVELQDREMKQKDESDKQGLEERTERSRRRGLQLDSREYREGKKSRKLDSESYHREDRKKGKLSLPGRDSSPDHHRGRDR